MRYVIHRLLFTCAYKRNIVNYSSKEKGFDV